MEHIEKKQNNIEAGVGLSAVFGGGGEPEGPAPAFLSDGGKLPSMVVNWSKARSSVVGLPGIPQRASIVFDNPGLDRIAGEVGRRPNVLMQVDLAHEPTKSGADLSELPAIVEALDAASHLHFAGLMANQRRPAAERQ